MNAHINNDLAHALVLTWHEFGFDSGACAATTTRSTASSRRSRRTSRSRSPTRLIAEVDTAFGTTDDFLALWSIRHARDQAWERARIMQHVPGDELDGLFDRIVGFAGNLLLGPAV